MREPWEWYNPIVKRELTGAQKTRVQMWTHKMIMQVEVKITRARQGVKDQTPTAEYYVWRDAEHGDHLPRLPRK